MNQESEQALAGYTHQHPYQPQPSQCVTYAPENNLQHNLKINHHAAEPTLNASIVGVGRKGAQAGLGNFPALANTYHTDSYSSRQPLAWPKESNKQKMYQFNNIMSAEGECRTSHGQVSMNLETYAGLYQLGQKTTIVDCVTQVAIDHSHTTYIVPPLQCFYRPKTF